MAILGPQLLAALHRFEQDPLVQKVRVHHDRILVSYLSGIHEVWGLMGEKPRRLTFPMTDWSGHQPRFAPWRSDRYFAQDYDSDADPMFVVGRGDIRRAGFLDRRLLVQRLVQRLLREGWMPPEFEHEDMDKDLERVRADEQRFVLSAGYLRGQPKRPHSPPPGMVLALNMIDWGSLRSPGRPTLQEAWSNPRRLYWVVRGLVEQGREITRISIVHRMLCGKAEGFPMKAGPKWSSPALWRAVLADLLRLRRPVVLDLDPGCGSRAVAVASLGGVYLSPSPRWTTEGREWADRQGALLVEDDGCTADVGIFGDLRDRSVEELVRAVEKYGPRCATLLGVARGEDRTRLREALPGADLIRFRPRPFTRSDDLLVVAHQM